jgi:hypothetical protein
MTATIIKTLTHEDIRDLLIGFAAAIELDQIRVDALPPNRFHPAYSDGMWRRWRRNHIDYVDYLLPTVQAMPPALLKQLTELALTYEPTGVRAAALNLFSHAASEGCPWEEIDTASLFFGWLTKEVSDNDAASHLNGDARTLMRQWLTVADPLWIAKDSECGYGQPGAFVS